MIITVDIEGPRFEDPEVFARYVVALLETMVPSAQDQIRVFKLPPVLKSGVRFRDEPAGFESLIGPRKVYQRGFGDCAHLCLWRVAELRNQGNPATFKIAWNATRPEKRYFHVQVRSGLPLWKPEKQRFFEDTSVLLGMTPGSYEQ